MNSAALHNTAPNAWVVRGALTFDTVPALWQQTAVWLQGNVPLTIDLAEVGLIDSAGLALLLGWQGRAQVAGLTLRYQNLPQRLLALASITDTQTLLTGG